MSIPPRTPVSTRLDQIVAATRRRVAETRAQANLRDLEQAAESHVPRGFRSALANHQGTAVIAELKMASPSKGLIRANFDVKSLAQQLQSAGAAALSVLTDEEFFRGSLENLRIASSITRIPCLRKDFMIDEFQMVEARANQADAILLIVAALSQSELIALRSNAKEQQLDVLCEVHDEDELKRALDAGCDLIGVNSRNLKTFEVALDTALNLAQKMPKGVITVAESGIRSADDIAKLKAAGYQAFLIGESLMSAKSPGDALRALIEAPVQLQ
jgi:indole-3-glycerol phosphate synthase